MMCGTTRGVVPAACRWVWTFGTTRGVVPAAWGCAFGVCVSLCVFLQGKQVVFVAA